MISPNQLCMDLPEIGLPTLIFFSNGPLFQQSMNFYSRLFPSKDSGSVCNFNVTCLLIHLSPFSTYQFEVIGAHGTKVIIYNLWLNDEGIYELSFDDDDEVLTLPQRVRGLCSSWDSKVF